MPSATAAGPGSAWRRLIGPRVREKVIMAALRAPEGDFRPWDEIDAWAWNIAKVLKAEPATV